MSSPQPPLRPPDFAEVAGAFDLMVVTFCGAGLSFFMMLGILDFGPFEEKSGMPRGDFFFIIGARG